MKLISLSLHNFRQFWGETHLALATTPERSITIIHGNNGAGKTTLMNAFTWVLYNRFSAAFAIGDLVNKRAIAEASLSDAIPCAVEFTFEHNSKLYEAQRSCTALKREDGSAEESASELELKIDGVVQPEDEAENALELVLPESLHRYFFFDGERIEQLVKSENRAEMAQAIKTLISVEVLDRGIRHLNEARKELERELREIGDAETKILLAEKRERESTIVDQEGSRLQIAEELEQQEALRQKLTAQLRNLDSVREVQERRLHLESELEEAERQLEYSETRLRRSIADRGHVVFLQDAIAQFNAFSAELRQRGELPAGIKHQFVQDLLDQGHCICGTALESDSAPRQKVETWLNRSGLLDVEESVIRMGGEVDALERQIPEFWAELDQEQGSIENWRRRISRLQDQLSDIRSLLRGNEDTNVQGIEKRLEEIEQRKADLIRADGRCQQLLETAENSIRQLNRQIKEQRLKGREQKLAKRRVAATLDAIERLEEVRRRVDFQFRSVLEQKVREIFRQISFTPYLPVLTEDYELRLVDRSSGTETVVPASTGENQILSLAFIGGVIDRVRAWAESHDWLGMDGNALPMVMDSPFGSLDELNRRNVAQAIAQLGDQVVIMVSKTQWRGEVATEMAPFVGQEYVLTYNSPKDDCEEDAIALEDGEYSLVRRSASGFEWTEIIEVGA